MAFGTKNEEFLVEECPEIFRFLYPVSEKKEDNYILESIQVPMVR